MSVLQRADIGADAPLNYEMPPSEIRILRQGRVLQLLWARHGPMSLTAATLRASCRCAECTSARRRNSAPAVDPDVSITDVQPIGAGALNLHFSDGHRRGIFPFAWLASLDDEALRDGVAP